MKRLFDIRKKGLIIDLTQSYIIKGENQSRWPMTSEIYLVTFTLLKNIKKEYCFFLNYNELIEEETLETLKNELNIEIQGDGAYFEILDYKQDFKIQFDPTESEFIDSKEVTEGCVIFNK